MPSTQTFRPRCRAGSAPRQGYAVGRRLIFLHIPKTAGTAITSFLRQQFEEAEVMPQLEANFHRSHPLWPLVARRSRLLGVGMHLDHDHVSALARGLSAEAPPFLLTVLREPRERLLSRYKEWRSTPDEHMQAAPDYVKQAILTARNQSFSGFLHSNNPEVVLTLDNLQARLLAGLNLSRNLQPEEVLERARAHLAGYDLVGTTDTCDETLQLLADAYGWPQPQAALARVHASQPVSEDLLRTSDADEEKIAAYTALDQALWDDLMQDRLTDPPSATNLSGIAATLPRRQAMPSDPVARGKHPAPGAAAVPGYILVSSLIREIKPHRVFGVGCRNWFHGLEEDPVPLRADERVLFVLRFPNLSHQRSVVLRQVAGSSASLLAIPDIDRSDPRLCALMQQLCWQPYATLLADADDAVLVFAAGRFLQDRGAGELDTAIEMLERLSSTHPAAVRSLRDAPVSRVLTRLVLMQSLQAAIHALESPSSAQVHEALLATLRPEGRDPLLPGGESTANAMEASWQQLLRVLPQPTELPADLISRLRTQAQSTLGDVSQAADVYAAMFELLQYLIPPPPVGGPMPLGWA